MDRKITTSIIRVESLSASEKKQRSRVLKESLYAPSGGRNGYKQKVMKKISYCEDFVYFLYYITDFSMRLCDLVSFNEIAGRIWFETHNCCIQSDGCNEVVAIAYDVNEFSKRKVEIMSDVLSPIISRPLINLIVKYYEDQYPNSNMHGFCGKHLDEMYDNPAYHMVMMFDRARWFISTHQSPERLL
jgi:hypothetical protein